MRYFESLDDFYKECFNHNSIKELCETLHIGRTTVNRYLRELKTRCPEKYFNLKIFWKAKYDENCSIRASKKIDSIRTKYTLDDSAFDTMTEESAYWLGMLASDGCVHKNKNKISINLQIKDKEHIEKFATFLSYSGDVKTRFIKTGNKRHEIAYFEFYSKHIKQKLSEYGIVSAKSNLDINYLTYIPDEYKLNFIFGYLDGDGHISSCDITSKVKIEILGNKTLIEDIHAIMNSAGILKAHIRIDNRFQVPKYNYIIQNMNDCLTFLNLYTCCPHILNRKKVNAEKWIRIINDKLKKNIRDINLNNIT